MDAKLNQLGKVDDFERAIIIAQYAHENGFRGGTGLELYQFIKSRLDLTGLSNTAGLPEDFPEPNTTLEATNAGEWTVLGPGSYNKIGTGMIEITDDEFAFAQFDGTDFNRVVRIRLPHGRDGVDGASLLKPWSEESEDYPYGQNIAVRDADGVIHVSLVDNNTFPLTDETRWLSVGGGFKIEQLDDLVKIIDADDNELASWDAKGKFRTQHAENSISANAIEKLPQTLAVVDSTQQANDDLIQFLDGEDRTIAHVDKDGVWNIPAIKTASIQVIEDESNVKVTGKRFFKIQNVDMLQVDIIEGALPTDSSPTRLPTELVIELSSNGKKLITLNVEAKVQGNSTAGPGFDKLGYTFDLYNDDWKSVDIAVNELVQTDSFHIKAFWTDTTHTRDVGCNMLFYEMAKSRPAGEFFKEPELREDYNIKLHDINTEGARWGTWGIPCVISWSGNFYGLYTWRLKKKRQNYKVNRDNENHIFIENDVYNVRLGAREYPDFESIYTDYEFRSPRNITGTVEINTVDFFTWARGVYTGNIDLRGTYQEHIILSAWLDVIIHGEVIGHKDSILNNAQYITYDGKIWQPLFTDGDACMGMAGTNNVLVKEEIGYTFANKDIFLTIRQEFLPELKERYTQLRNNGTLSFQGFRNIFGGISQKIPQDIYQYDYEKWGSRSLDIPTMNQIYYYLMKRLEWLDAQWLND